MLHIPCTVPREYGNDYQLAKCTKCLLRASVTYPISQFTAILLKFCISNYLISKISAKVVTYYYAGTEWVGSSVASKLNIITCNFCAKCLMFHYMQHNTSLSESAKLRHGSKIIIITIRYSGNDQHQY